MEYRRLGNTGMHVSVISIGAWLTYGSSKVEFDTAKECLHLAVENGINFIDVADMYSLGKAEETVAEVIRDHDRSKLVISSKAYFPMSDDINDKGLSRKHLTESVHKSLKRLNTDYLDIFFCHRYDNNTPTEETVRAIEDLVRAGKILYWGTSMWTAENLEEGIQAADRYNAYRPVVEQPLYNMLDRDVVEGNLENTLINHGIGLVVWSPLAGGLLTGKYDEGIPEDSRAATHKWDYIQQGFTEYRIEQARKVNQFARELGVTPAALALAWAMAHPNVDSVITGATKPSQVTSNLAALDLQITPEIARQIEDLLQNKPLNSHRDIVDPNEISAL